MSGKRTGWQSIGGSEDWHLSIVRKPPARWTAPGCYAIYLDRELVYIGSSERVTYRLMAYPMRINMFVGATEPAVVTPWGMAFSVTIKFKPSRRYGDWLMREARLIRRLKPRGNTHGVKRERACV